MLLLHFMEIKIVMLKRDITQIYGSWVAKNPVKSSSGAAVVKLLYHFTRVAIIFFPHVAKVPEKTVSKLCPRKFVKCAFSQSSPHLQ